MSINVSEVIWTIVCFFALLFVLKKFLFDPLIRFMEQRQAAIDQGLERGRDAQRKKDENDAALREKWKELLAEGKTADDRERAWVLESTQKETNKALQEANQRIEQERRQVCADAQEQLPQLVSILAQQLLSGDTGGEER